jgi:hypothetical protein
MKDQASANKGVTYIPCLNELELAAELTRLREKWIAASASYERALLKLSDWKADPSPRRAPLAATQGLLELAEFIRIHRETGAEAMEELEREVFEGL